MHLDCLLFALPHNDLAVLGASELTGGGGSLTNHDS